MRASGARAARLDSLEGEDARSAAAAAARAAAPARRRRRRRPADPVAQLETAPPPPAAGRGRRRAGGSGAGRAEAVGGEQRLQAVEDGGSPLIAGWATVVASGSRRRVGPGRARGRRAWRRGAHGRGSEAPLDRAEPFFPLRRRIDGEGGAGRSRIVVLRRICPGELDRRDSGRSVRRCSLIPTAYHSGSHSRKSE